MIILIILTACNCILCYVLIRNIQNINKSKEGSGFGSKEDIMNWRNEVTCKMHVNNLELSNLKKHIFSMRDYIIKEFDIVERLLHSKIKK